MSIATNKWGYDLLAFLPLDEEEVISENNYLPLTGSLVVLKCQEKFLMAHNKVRQQWEIPAGGIEKGETPRQCAERELFEETNQRADNLIFKGLVKIYSHRTKQLRYQALYYTELTHLKDFKENDEMDGIMLWDLKEFIGDFDEVDRKLIDCAEL